MDTVPESLTTARDTTRRLTERIPCKRCKATVDLMQAAMVPGELISKVARRQGELFVQIAACSAAGHPADVDRTDQDRDD